MTYLPEGKLINTAENAENLLNLKACLEKQTLLEARAIMCDVSHNLIVDLPNTKGVIPRNECAVGIDEGKVRDIAIITRVNKPVQFVIDKIDGATTYLSRKKVQEQYQKHLEDNLKKGDVIDAVVTHLEQFGAFVDIGAGVVSFIAIDNISVSRISHPRDRFSVGEQIKAVVKEIEAPFKITLSHKELLGTWEQNASRFEIGQTVLGIVRSVENYGIFVELAPNLAGLAEFKEDIFVGQNVSVYIKNIIPEKMKVKLTIIDTFDSDYVPIKTQYFTDAHHLYSFVYSPSQSEKYIASDWLEE